MKSDTNIEENIKDLIEMEADLLNSYYGEAVGEIKGNPNNRLYKSIREVRREDYTRETEYFLKLFNTPGIIDELIFTLSKDGDSYFSNEDLEAGENDLIIDRIMGKLFYLLGSSWRGTSLIEIRDNNGESFFKTLEKYLIGNDLLQFETNMDRNIALEHLRRMQYYIDKCVKQGNYDDANTLITQKYEIAYANSFLDTDWYLAQGNGHLLFPVTYDTLAHEADSLEIPRISYTNAAEIYVMKEAAETLEFLSGEDVDEYFLPEVRAELEAMMSFLSNEAIAHLSRRVSISPEYPEARGMLSEVLKGSFKESFQYAKTQRPPEGYRNLGFEELDPPDLP